MNIELKHDQGGGIGFFGVLTILFIALKLLKIINWSWIWVLAPIWIPLSIGLMISVVVFVAIFMRKWHEI